MSGIVRRVIKKPARSLVFREKGTPCRGCSDKVTITKREYRKLAEANAALIGQRARVAALQDEVARLQSADPDSWRDGGSDNECGFVLRHNPEVCDACAWRRSALDYAKERSGQQNVAMARGLAIVDRPILPTDPLWRPYYVGGGKADSLRGRQDYVGWTRPNGGAIR